MCPLYHQVCEAQPQRPAWQVRVMSCLQNLCGDCAARHERIGHTTCLRQPVTKEAHQFERRRYASALTDTNELPLQPSVRAMLQATRRVAVAWLCIEVKHGVCTSRVGKPVSRAWVQ